MVPSDPATAFARFSRLWSEPWLEGKKEIDVPGKRTRERQERKSEKERARAKEEGEDEEEEEVTRRGRDEGRVCIFYLLGG